MFRKFRVDGLFDRGVLYQKIKNTFNSRCSRRIKSNKYLIYAKYIEHTGFVEVLNLLGTAIIEIKEANANDQFLKQYLFDFRVEKL